MNKIVGKDWLRVHSGDLLSYGGLVLCLIIFSILSKGKLWSAYNVGILIQAACVYAILAMGAVFIYSMGYMDISVGRRPLLESAFDAFGIDVAGYGFPAHSG